MLTVNIVYHAETRTLDLGGISTGKDTVVVGTSGDDRSTILHFIMDGDVSRFDRLYAEFDVNVPDPSKKTYIKPALELDQEYNVILPAYIMSNVLRKTLPMQLALESTTEEIRAVSVNTVMLRVADAVDADHTPYNVIVPEPVTTVAGVFTAIVGDGQNIEFDIPHNLDTYNIGVLAYRNDDHTNVAVNWEMVNTNIATVIFDEPPEQDAMTVVVFRAGNGIYDARVFQVSSKQEMTNLTGAGVGDFAYLIPLEGYTEVYQLTDFYGGGYSNIQNWQILYTSDTVTYSPTYTDDATLPAPEVTFQ